MEITSEERKRIPPFPKHNNSFTREGWEQMYLKTIRKNFRLCLFVELYEKLRELTNNFSDIEFIDSIMHRCTKGNVFNINDIEKLTKQPAFLGTVNALKRAKKFNPEYMFSCLLLAIVNKDEDSKRRCVSYIQFRFVEFDKYFLIIRNRLKKEQYL